MKFSAHSKITISQQVLAQEVNGETVLLDLDSENYFGLDPVATRVWQLLQEGQSLGQIIDQLLTEYDVEKPQLENDIDTLLTELGTQNLINIAAVKENTAHS